MIYIFKISFELNLEEKFAVLVMKIKYSTKKYLRFHEQNGEREFLDLGRPDEAHHVQRV